MTELSWTALVKFVHEHTEYRCEYCQTPQQATGQAMHVEHIIPNSGNDPDGLCLSCASCNLSKAQATEAIDPETNELVSLFNPRTQVWSEHFEWIKEDTVINGKTAIGRATSIRLKMNLSRLVEARKIWVLAGIHPPK
jgi:5-methylcytosine-specific restriction endonuclease McrA